MSNPAPVLAPGESPPDFIVEECSDADEADVIANHYRSIIAKIQKRKEEQSMSQESSPKLREGFCIYIDVLPRISAGRPR
jgi:hypothetical protein